MKTLGASRWCISSCWGLRWSPYSVVSTGTGGEPGRFVVTQGQFASMRVGFTRTWQRPPTREEWEGLIRDRVRQEVYYRKALGRRYTTRHGRLMPSLFIRK